jgi:hypothetical protein
MIRTEQSGTASVIPLWEKPFFLFFNAHGFVLPDAP